MLQACHKTYVTDVCHFARLRLICDGHGSAAIREVGLELLDVTCKASIDRLPSGACGRLRK